MYVEQNLFHINEYIACLFQCFGLSMSLHVHISMVMYNLTIETYCVASCLFYVCIFTELTF